ncbi:MAG: hypothetical protein IT328_18495 [Caldilineaceae bacterium]|nr:hypothetical protein [Caldilineaceae bacterium]
MIERRAITGQAVPMVELPATVKAFCGMFLGQLFAAARDEARPLDT